MINLSCTGSALRKTSLQFLRLTSTTRTTGRAGGGDRFTLNCCLSRIYHSYQTRRRGEGRDCDNVAVKAVRVKVVAEDELSLLPAQVGIGVICLLFVPLFVSSFVVCLFVC